VYADQNSDCVSHLAEELPNPRVNIPKAIFAQYAVGCITALLYVITIFYAVNDLDSLFVNPWPFPLAELYRQATNSHAGSMGLLIVIFLPTACTAIGCYITAGRMLWTLGRDNATPFSNWIGHIDKRFECPVNATLICGIINTILGCIYIGSLTAFSAFVGSFIVLSSASYLAFILPNIITRRKHITPGPFTMPDWIFYPIAGTACAYMCVFIVIYCFPYGVPFTAQTMNYSSLIVGGLSIFVAGWWFYIKDKGYTGPKELEEEVRRLSIVEGIGRVSVSKD
jgi:choline transport protein